MAGKQHAIDSGSSTDPQAHPAGESQRAAFRQLARHEAEEVLARNHVGRIAFAMHDRVDIEPVNYVYDNGWLYGRTSPGTKLAVIAHHQWVAFEVDESNGLFDWRSVVVKGFCDLIDSDMSSAHAPTYAHAMNLLRQLLPESLTAEDPVPFRKVLFRIHLDEVTGREAKLASASTPADANAAPTDTGDTSG